MNMFSFLFFMLLAYASSVSTANLKNNDACSPSQQVKNIFILAGQSNMSGRGGLVNDTWDRFIPRENRPNPSILRLSADSTWVEARDPLHKDIDTNAVCGVGPGMSFANSLREKDSSLGVIGLVPCAIGGTGISEWGPGTKLYNQLLKRAEKALEGGGTMRAMLWYQGESDTINLQDAKMYKMRLERFFTHLRIDLQLPALPIIQVALASGQGPYIDIVREAQLGLDLPNVIRVDANGLPLESDFVHLRTSAQVKLGEIMADTFLQSVSLPIQSSATRRFHNFASLFFRPFMVLYLFYFPFFL